MWPTLRQLLVGFLSTIYPQRVPVAPLVTATKLFGFSDNQIRVMLSRLVRANTFERDENGHYGLASSTKPIHELARSWREIPKSIVP